MTAHKPARISAGPSGGADLKLVDAPQRLLVDDEPLAVVDDVSRDLALAGREAGQLVRVGVGDVSGSRGASA